MEKKDFVYTYSATEQEELRRIRDKYAPKSTEEDKMERLRRLDRSVGTRASAAALILGVIGTLVLGFGMSLIMTELSAWLGLVGAVAMTVGIIVGLVGGAIAAAAYPIYSLVLARERERVAPEILRLTEELMK